MTKRKKHMQALKEIENCVICGSHSVETAHYSGMCSARLGKGMGCKSDDYLTARLCRSCHVNFDQHKNGNNERESNKFLLAIGVTLEKLHEMQEIDELAIKIMDNCLAEWLDFYEKIQFIENDLK